MEEVTDIDICNLANDSMDPMECSESDKHTKSAWLDGNRIYWRFFHNGILRLSFRPDDNTVNFGRFPLKIWRRACSKTESKMLRWMSTRDDNSHRKTRFFFSKVDENFFGQVVHPSIS